MTTKLIEANSDVQSKADGTLIEALNWLYDQVSGSTEDDAASDALLSDDDIDWNIAYYCTGAGVASFATNVGGVLTLPIALPANLLSVAALQLRLVAKIASARGYDPRSHEVRMLAIVCLTGSAALDILKDAGIQIGRKLGEKAIAQISSETIFKINQAVGFRLLTKTGSQGAVNLTKFVPFIGGFVAGTVDALATKAVGEIAKQVFKAKPGTDTAQNEDTTNPKMPGTGTDKDSGDEKNRHSVQDQSWWPGFLSW